MPISQYLHQIRSKVGTDLLLMPSVTAIAWNASGHLLLIRQHENGPWTLPGGIIDPGESPAQALVREVWEETGVRIRPVRILGVFGGPEGFRRTYLNRDQVEFVDIVFECQGLEDTLECRDGEAVESRYFGIDELDELSISYPISLNTLVRPAKEPVFHWDERWLADTCELEPQKKE